MTSECPSKIVSTNITSFISEPASQFRVLIEHPTYRRLYNIVKNHIQKKQSQFRNNLIKQLYFLLKIVPIIEKSVLDHFLNQVQKWYDSNDHKKINMASKGLQRMVKEYVKPKDRYSNSKSIYRSVKDSKKIINPFDRPFTAQANYKKSQNRPISSTKEQNLTQYNNKKSNENSFVQFQYPINIDQQMERSQDFVQKYRTVHPLQEPPHEQLYHILTKANNIGLSQDSELIKKASNPMDKIIKVIHDKIEQQNKNDMLDELEEGQSECSEQTEQNSIQQNQNQSFQNKKIYEIDRKKAKIFEKRRPLTALLNAKDLTKQEHNTLDRLQKLNHTNLNTKAQWYRQNTQIIDKRLDYMHKKTRINQEINRKNQSNKFKNIVRRIKSANPLKIGVANNKKAHDEDKDSILNNDTNIDNTKFYDMSQTGQTLKIQRPFYNQLQVLQKKYKQQIQKYKKPSKNGIQRVLSAQPSNFRQPQRLLSTKKFNPTHINNVIEHNQQVLKDIQKVKLRLNGKAYLPNNVLMKALYIDGFDHDEHYYGNFNFGEKQNLRSSSNFKHQSKTQRQIPRWKSLDKSVFMISNGQKKKKTKKRKLKKNKNKK